MSDDRYAPSRDKKLSTYPCGLSSGDRLVLKRDLVVEDHEGRSVDRIHRAGGIWTVATGDDREPAVIWLREPDGSPHTWDAESIFDAFSPVDE